LLYDRHGADSVGTDKLTFTPERRRRRDPVSRHGSREPPSGSTSRAQVLKPGFNAAAVEASVLADGDA
jgi:hypothetical protein